MSLSRKSIINQLSALRHSKDEETEIFLRTIRGHEVELHNAERKGDAYKWMLGTFEDTIYKDTGMQEEWEIFYLPVDRRMQVLGEVYHTSWDSTDPKLVLMLCKDDGMVYAYDDEYLHQVAKNLNAVNTKGIMYPSKTVYYNGQRFADMTDEELNEMDEWEEVKKVKESYKEENDKWRKEAEEAMKDILKFCVNLCESNTDDAPKSAEDSATGESFQRNRKRKAPSNSAREAPLAKSRLTTIQWPTNICIDTTH